MMSRLASWLYTQPLYAFTLAGAVPQRLSHLPPTGEPGDAARGQRILAGALACANHKFTTAQPAWFDPAAERAALAALHDFHYLADLASAGEAGHSCGRALIASWIASGSQWHDVTWAPEILGRRIAAWLSQTGVPSSSASSELGREILESLARQTRHLARVLTTGTGGAARLDAAKGLIYGAACGIASPRALDRALTVLRQELSRQVREDGSHVERSPAGQHTALTNVIDIRDMLQAAGHAVPDWLSAAISQLAPMLRFFRHNDRELALFNGAMHGSAKAIDALLLRSLSKKPAPATAPDGGFQRLVAGTTLVIQDVGGPPPPGLDAAAHAGCLAFEMSDGPDRLVVNCGAAPGARGEALRATAAHSTLVVANVNSAEVLPGGGLKRRPTHVESARDDMDGNIWVTASHDGYRERFGLTHRRRLYLSAAGDNLRGEDTLMSANPDTAHEFAVRFHLGPDVKASLFQDAAGVLLQTPSGSGWRFQTSGGVPHLEESIYFSAEATRRTRQIVVHATTTGAESIVKWAFQKLAMSGGR